MDFNAAQAAIRAGYAPTYAGQYGHNLLKEAGIAERIEIRKQELAAAAAITPEWVLSQWLKLATADPNELSQVRRVNCRYCHGFDHQYKWTPAEYADAVNAALDAKPPREPPCGYGGLDFDHNADPHPDCPECAGEGVEVVKVSDTRKLTPQGKGLFAGVKQTKDGIQVLVRDQDAALANISRFLGMSVEKKELSGPGGKPLAIANLKSEDFTDDQLAALINAEASENDNKE